MPVRTASTVTFFYALGYPVGNAAVAAMSPMAILVFRFALAAAILGTDLGSFPARAELWAALRTAGD